MKKDKTHDFFLKTGYKVFDEILLNLYLKVLNNMYFLKNAGSEVIGQKLKMNH